MIYIYICISGISGIFLMEVENINNYFIYKHSLLVLMANCRTSCKQLADFIKYLDIKNTFPPSHILNCSDTQTATNATISQRSCRTSVYKPFYNSFPKWSTDYLISGKCSQLQGYTASKINKSKTCQRVNEIPEDF